MAAAQGVGICLLARHACFHFSVVGYVWGNSSQRSTQPLQACAARKFRRAYSIQWSNTERGNAKKPQELSKQEFAFLLRRRHQENFDETAEKEQVPHEDRNFILKIMIWDELHADGRPHKYAMVLADRPYACELVRAILAKKDKIHIMFGTAHAYWWTGVVYGCVPSVHKALAEIDPEPYHSEGLTVREELMDMPRGARLADKQRVREFLGVAAAGAGAPGPGSKNARLGKEELAEQIRQNGWKTRAQMCAAATADRPENPSLYNAMLHMGSKDLEEMIAWVWELEGVDLMAEPVVDRIAILCRTVAWHPPFHFLLSILVHRFGREF